MVFCKFFVIFVSTVVSVCAYAGVLVNVVSRVSAVYTVTPVLYTSDHRPASSLFTTWRTLLILGRPGRFIPALPTRLFIIVSRRIVVIVVRNRVEPGTGSAYGIAQCSLGGTYGKDH